MDLVDGAVPAAQLEELVQRIRHDPRHPGRHLRGMCERKSLSIPDAAGLIGVRPAVLDRVIEGRAPVTPQLALRLEAAGWPGAEFWMRLQSKYDLARARLAQEAA